MENQQQSYFIDWIDIQEKYPKCYKIFKKTVVGHSYGRLDIVVDFFEQNGFDIHINYQYMVRGKWVLWKVAYNKGIDYTSIYGTDGKHLTRKSAYYSAIMKCFDLMEFSLSRND